MSGLGPSLFREKATEAAKVGADRQPSNMIAWVARTGDIIGTELKDSRLRSLRSMSRYDVDALTDASQQKGPIALVMSNTGALGAKKLIAPKIVNGLMGGADGNLNGTIALSDSTLPNMAHVTFEGGHMENPTVTSYFSTVAPPDANIIDESNVRASLPKGVSSTLNTADALSQVADLTAGFSIGAPLRSFTGWISHMLAPDKVPAPKRPDIDPSTGKSTPVPANDNRTSLGTNARTGTAKITPESQMLQSGFNPHIGFGPPRAQ